METAPTVIDDEGEHYVFKYIEPFIVADKELVSLIQDMPISNSSIGYWIRKQDGIRFWEECSICGFRSVAITNFCPNCGKTMKEG